MRDFRKLKVWEKAHELVLEAYHVTAGFPREDAKSCMGLRPNFDVLVSQSQQTSQRVVAEKARPS